MDEQYDQYDPKTLSESMRAWKRLKLDHPINPAWYYYSILAMERGIRGSIVMLYAIAKETGLYSTEEEKKGMLLSSLSSTLTPQVAYDLLRVMADNRKKLAQAMNMKSGNKKMILHSLKKDKRNAQIPQEILVAHAEYVAAELTEDMKKAIEEINEKYKDDVNLEGEWHPDPDAIESIMQTALFRYVQEVQKDK